MKINYCISSITNQNDLYAKLISIFGLISFVMDGYRPTKDVYKFCIGPIFIKSRPTSDSLVICLKYGQKEKCMLTLAQGRLGGKRT